MTGRSNQMERLSSRVNELAEPVCMAENMELVETACIPGKGGVIVRLYMDKPGGITLEDCTHMSRQIGDLIDVYIDGIESYTLEVSSPGPNRLLRKRDDFIRFSGSRVKIETDEPVDERKKITGVLKHITEDGVRVAADNREHVIQFENISRARLAGLPYGEVE